MINRAHLKSVVFRAAEGFHRPSPQWAGRSRRVAYLSSLSQVAAKVTRRLIKKALFLLVGISPAVCCGRPESFSAFLSEPSAEGRPPFDMTVDLCD